MTNDKAIEPAQDTSAQPLTGETKSLTASGALDLIDHAIGVVPWAAGAVAAGKVAVEAIRQNGETRRTEIHEQHETHRTEIRAQSGTE
ncbi:MAG: hypothetical protein HOV87_12015 [Catenulispora sp.]|nr:hypothetical protein [Catenulispora sp.]NUT40024.1 hypothetical protein [Thermoactinospora sp.]